MQSKYFWHVLQEVLAQIHNLSSGQFTRGGVAGLQQ